MRREKVIGTGAKSLCKVAGAALIFLKTTGLGQVQQ
jgi:hypothetical protein